MANVRGFVNGVMVDDKELTGGASSYTWSSVLGPNLVTKDGSKPTDEVLANKNKVALLFAGQWCPWCRAFEQKLSDTMDKVNAAHANDTEVVYLSSDRDEAAFNEAAAKYGWPAMPYSLAQGSGDERALAFVPRKARQEGKLQGVLGEKYKLGGLPSVVVLDGSTGELLHEKFVKDKGDKPEDGFEWAPNTPASWLEVSEA
mmetsp:Transcript_58100/g.138222  ORF Transcript_58100/g.138222 Transcript_58100/m.138222 type:complete len:201 (-) Transcript_58100:221-823(-)